MRQVTVTNRDSTLEIPKSLTLESLQRIQRALLLLVQSEGLSPEQANKLPGVIYACPYCHETARARVMEMHIGRCPARRRKPTQLEKRGAIRIEVTGSMGLTRPHPALSEPLIESF